jgi:hypothetical protein
VIKWKITGVDKVFQDLHFDTFSFFLKLKKVEKSRNILTPSSGLKCLDSENTLVAPAGCKCIGNEILGTE